MTLELTTVKRQLQDQLQEGLLLVVGAGLSIAEGIPGMRALAEHLKDIIPQKLVDAPDPAWNEIVAALDGGDHLEAAMAKTMLASPTVDAIVAASATLIANKEREVFERVLSGRRQLPFTVFAKHLFKAGKRFHLITPNYDRLIELATEVAGIGVDSRFCGYLYGSADPKRSADAHRESYVAGRSTQLRPLPCLSVYKPHGSLDWFDIGDRIIRSPIGTSKVPMIITPGASKYRESFRSAFDDQRTSGNRCVASATRLMFIGYGFNDDHLEQQLCPGLKVTRPSVIVTKVLTENARRLVKNSIGTDVIALSAVSDSDHRTRILSSTGEELIVDEELWHLQGFNMGVL